MIKLLTTVILIATCYSAFGKNIGAVPFMFGGNDVEPKEIPYHVFIAVYRTPVYVAVKLCSGVLISRNFVLTSAWCLVNSTQAQVTFGMVDPQSSDKSTTVGIWSSDTIIHENYNEQTHENDLALLKLQSTVRPSDYIRVATLPKYSEADNDYAGKTGRLSAYYQAIRKLQFLKAKILTNEECKTQLSFVDDTMTCLPSTDKKSACEGDYGAPLVVNNKVIGIETYVGVTCPSYRPSVFTKIGSHLEWLEINSDVILY